MIDNRTSLTELEAERREISKAERQRWFSYYSVLKNNQLVNILLVRSLQNTCKNKFGVSQGGLLLLIALRLLRRSKNGITGKKVAEVMATFMPITRQGLDYIRRPLVSGGYITYRKQTYTLTGKGNGVITSFQFWYHKAMNEAMAMLPDLD